MSNKNIIIVHDVLGTLFSLTKPTALVSSLFSSQLGGDSQPAVRARYAELVVMDWYHCGQRDFTNLSLNGSYTPIGQVFKAAINRVLLMSGLVPPELAEKEGGQVSEETLRDVRARAAKGENVFGDIPDQMMATLPALESRPGMVEAFSKTYRSQELRPKSVGHVSLWGATNGSLDLAGKLFNTALGQSGVQKQDTQAKGDGYSIWSCDEIKVAKPDPRVYEAVKRKVLEGDGLKADDSSLWFVASHTWDTDAAKRAG